MESELKIKRYHESIDEVYENYLTNFIPPTCPPNLDVQPSYYEPMTKEWFIKSIKESGLRGEKFSEKWGLKIKERELSLTERRMMVSQEMFNQVYTGGGPETLSHQECDQWNIPKKLITIKYKKEKIQVYK